MFFEKKTIFNVKITLPVGQKGESAPKIFSYFIILGPTLSISKVSSRSAKSRFSSSRVYVSLQPSNETNKLITLDALILFGPGKSPPK